MADVLVVLSLLLVAAAATGAVFVRDPARQALVLSLLGLSLSVLFLVLQAPDVALSQLAVGSALTPLLLLLTVRKVRRGPARGSEEPGTAGGSEARTRRRAPGPSGAGPTSAEEER